MSRFVLDIDRLHRDILNEETSPRSGNTVRWCVEVMGMIGLELTPIYIEVPNMRVAEYYLNEILLPMLQNGGYGLKSVNRLSFKCEKSDVHFIVPNSPGDHFGGMPRYVVRSDYWG